MFVPEKRAEFEAMIDSTYREISKHLIDVLFNKYHFINHLKVSAKKTDEEI